MKATWLPLAAVAAMLLPCVVVRGQSQEVPREGRSVSAWLERTKDPNPSVRDEAAIELQDMGPYAEAAAPGLARLLSDSDSGVREQVAFSLGGMRRDATLAVPALTKLLDDVDGDVRRTAAKALGQFGPEAEPAVPALTKMLGEEQWTNRFAAAEALGEIGPEATAVPALTKMLDDELGTNRKAAAEALGMLGPEAKSAVPRSPCYWKVMLTNVPDAALKACWPELARKPKRPCRRSEDCSRGNCRPVNRNAFRALGEIGPGAKEAVADLVEEMLQDPFYGQCGI